MSSSSLPFVAAPQQARLPYPYRPEVDVVEAALATLQGQLDWAQVIRAGRPWVEAVRDKPAPFWAMESLLREYPISSAEGLALMRLAEALLRVPDVETAIALTADQLGRAEFDADSVVDGPHKMLAGISASAISLSKKFLPGADGEGGLLKRLGAKTVVAATVRAIQLLGRQFVLGRTIGEAMEEAQDQRKDMESARRGAANAATGLRFSYDMLGEGARTEHDAERYLASYANAIQAISRGQVAASPETADGISIKLSALFSRYEDGQRERVFAELLPRVWSLIEQAAQRQPEPDDRRRGDRPPRAVAGRAGRARRPHRRRLPEVDAASAWPCRPTRRARCRSSTPSPRSRAATSCASWCAWSRAPTGTARSSARRKAA